jgi:tyrosyl-tRNA synthetase
VRWNGEWFRAMSFTDILHLAAQFTVARMLERDDFERRYRAGEPISVHEFLYPLMQAYDSVVIRADVEIGATEQKFNLLAGRDIQMAYGVEPQVILTLPVLEGLDGARRMSKSLGNYIGIAEPPKEIFGKVMSLPDTLIERYFRLVTDATRAECDDVARTLASGENPKLSKKALAHRIVRMYHGVEGADFARNEFEAQFERHELPAEIATHEIEAGTYRARDLMMRAFPGQYTGSQAGALFKQGAVHLNGERLNDFGLSVTMGRAPHSIDEAIFKVGRRVARLVVRP